MIPSTKPGVVLDLGGEHELATGLVAGRRGLAFDDQGGELGPGGVDGRRQPGRTRPDDDDLVGLGHAAPLVEAAGSVRWLQATSPTMTKTATDHQVRQPDPAVEGVHGEQADQGDGQEGDGDHAGREDDDAEHDGPGGQGERSDGLVPEQRDQGVDEIGAPGGQVTDGAGARKSAGWCFRLRIHGARIVGLPAWAAGYGAECPVGVSVGGDHAQPDRARPGVGARPRVRGPPPRAGTRTARP